MSLSSDQARVQYTLSGSGQTLAVPFKFIAAADLAVISTTAGVDTTLVLNTNYTVTGGGSLPAIGNLTMVAGASGDIITIYRNAQILQPAVYAPNDAFPAKTTETSLDRATMEIQQLALRVNRSVRVPMSNAEPAEMTLAARKNKIIGFDAVGAVSLQDPLGAASLTGTVIETTSYSALRAVVVSGLATGRMATTTAYSSAPDGGEGMWKYDSTSSAADDNGTILAPNAGTGRWLRCYSGSVNAKWFGAKGDGSTDDTAALNAAALASAEINLPLGTYMVSSTVTISASNARLVGDGAKSIIKATVATFHPITLASTANGAFLANFAIYGAAIDATTIQTGIFTTTAPDDVVITNVTFAGPTATVGLNVGIKNNGGTGLRWRITGNIFLEIIGSSSSGYGILFGGDVGGGSSYAIISNNLFYCSGTRGRHAVYLSAGASRNLVTGNTIFGFQLTKIVVFALAAQATCTKNIISNNVSYAGGSGGTNGCFDVEGNATENVIQGNRSYDYNGYGVLISNQSNGATPTSNNQVLDNYIVRAAFNGIRVEGADKTLIKGNSMHEISDASAHTYFGIQLVQQNGTATSNTTIADNDVTGATNVAGGVAFDATSPVPTGTVITNNRFPNGGAGDYKIKTNGASYYGTNNYIALHPTSGNQGDASPTINAGLDEEIIRFASTLTADRTCTVGTATAYDNARFRIWRPGVGAFNLTVTDGTLSVVLAASKWCDIVYNSAAAAWQLVGYGSTS